MSPLSLLVACGGWIVQLIKCEAGRWGILWGVWLKCHEWNQSPKSRHFNLLLPQQPESLSLALSWNQCSLNPESEEQFWLVTYVWDAEAIAAKFWFQTKWLISILYNLGVQSPASPGVCSVRSGVCLWWLLSSIRSILASFSFDTVLKINLCRCFGGPCIFTLCRLPSRTRC